MQYNIKLKTISSSYEQMEKELIKFYNTTLKPLNIEPILYNEYRDRTLPIQIKFKEDNLIPALVFWTNEPIKTPSYLKKIITQREQP